MKGNLDGPVIVPNDLDKSRPYSVLNLQRTMISLCHPRWSMDQEQKDIIKRWIEEGAKPQK